MLSGSRQKILEHIRRHGESSVAELSEALGLTTVTIRHHLEAMQQDGLIKEPQPRHKPGPGRPEMFYHVSDSAEEFLPRSYENLCLALIDAARNTLPPMQVSNMIIKAGARVADLITTNHLDSGAKRSDLLMAFLNEQGYFPSEERQDGELFIHFANCPYLTVSEHAPEVCLFDLELTGNVLNANARFEKRIINGDPYCRLRLEINEAV